MIFNDFAKALGQMGDRAFRREGRAGARAMQQRYNSQIWMAGILMAIPLTIPIMNLFIPILGAATFTHLYHRLATQDD